jgi:hypothetical protein
MGLPSLSSRAPPDICRSSAAGETPISTVPFHRVVAVTRLLSARQAGAATNEGSPEARFDAFRRRFAREESTSTNEPASP